MSKRIDITGHKYGRLTVLYEDLEYLGRGRKWVCKCDCGTIKSYFMSNLRSKRNTPKTCGCIFHDGTLKKGTHNMRNSRLYCIWRSMKQRCLVTTSTAYHNYGGRGISICQEWIDNFKSFRDWAYSSGYSDNLTIDRINNDGDYCPENCRWISKKAQCSNKRTNVFFEYNGEIHTLTEWSEITGLNRHTIAYRINHNWPKDKILIEPPKHGEHKWV